MPPPTRPHVLVFTGGEPVPVEVLSTLPRATTVIAADSGLRSAQALGLPVHAVVGDMDSVEPDELAAAAAAGARIERHPAAKDATDLELAMDAAVELDPAAITVVGGAGGRLDHLLAAMLLLTAERYASIPVVARTGSAIVTVVRDVGWLSGHEGALVTLLAVRGPAEGVTTTGLRFGLAGERLEPGSTRGVSNEFTGERASVRLDTGVVLAIQPTTAHPTAP